MSAVVLTRSWSTALHAFSWTGPLAALPRIGSRADVVSFPCERKSPAVELDRLACALRAASDRLALPVARAAAAFVAREGWRTFGDVRLDDFARESLGRSGRWVREHARLHEAVTRFPALGVALTGADGAAPLGAEKAKLVARVVAVLADDAASADTTALLESWIARARATTVDALRREVRAALAASAAPGAGAAADELEPRRRVVIRMPQAVAAAFDEVCELARAAAGRDLSLAGVVDALLAEAPELGDAGPGDSMTGARDARTHTGAWIDDRWDRSRRARHARFVPHPVGEWPDIASHVDDSAVAFRARTTLAEFRMLDATAGHGDARALGEQLKRLVALEDALLRRLGDVVAELADRGAWATLPYTDVADYAERRLGLGATTVEDRVRAARALARRPHLRAAYDMGRVPLESALLALRALHGCDEDEAEVAWATRAAESTVKRMRDELRLVRWNAGPPATDAAWSAARRRDPGATRRAVLTAGLVTVSTVSSSSASAASEAGVFQRLTLPESTATRFLDAIESARRGITALVDAVPWDEPWPHAASMPSVLAGRTFSTRARRVPAWVGLLALLESAAMTWDDPRAIPRRPGDDVYRRSGYRCDAPGCTSRASLHEHHVRFRSRGGGDELANRITLCEAHHRMLHDTAALTAAGAAPLGVTWTKDGEAYRCERRLNATTLQDVDPAL